MGELTGEATYYETAAVAFDEARRIGLPWRMLWYQFEPYEAYLGNGRAADVLALTDAMITSEGGRYVEETFFYQGNAWLPLRCPRPGPSPMSVLWKSTRTFHRHKRRWPRTGNSEGERQTVSGER
ncbi:MAG: hypothetical protein R3E31_17855 [Chloroflexota bacterium]